MSTAGSARAALVLSAALAGSAAAAPASDAYPNYYAARQALAEGDCRATVTHLTDFLRAHPYVQQKYPGFYFDVRLVMQQCEGAVSVRGIESESTQIDPLPEDPPMVAR